jgi:hypothetical protein
MLADFYGGFNGGYFWDRALLLRPTQDDLGPLSVARWNESSLWRGLYGGAAAGLTFFGEDTFGVQFALHGNNVVSFDPETAEVSHCAGGFDEFVDLVVSEAEFYTGFPVLRAWEAEHGALEVGHRLVPRQAFMLGGEFSAADVVSRPDVEGMRMRAQLWMTTKDVRDGETIVFVKQ